MFERVVVVGLEQAEARHCDGPRDLVNNVLHVLSKPEYQRLGRIGKMPQRAGPAIPSRRGGLLDQGVQIAQVFGGGGPHPVREDLGWLDVIRAARDVDRVVAVRSQKLSEG